jgi:histidine decarboxylase
MTTVDHTTNGGTPAAGETPSPGSGVSVPGQRQPADGLIGPPERIPPVLAALRARLDAARPTNIGFPSTLDLDITPLLPFFNDVLNNVGDPDVASVFPAHTKALEREVVDIIAGLLRAPKDDRWGYVTSGGSEGVEYGALLGRTLHPDAVIYFPRSAHPAIAKIAGKLRIPAVTVRSHHDERMDLRDLRVALRHHRQHAAIVVANIGATLTEAVDDVSEIRRALAEAPITRAYVHADAALSGLPLALLPPEPRIGFDLADGADSVSISGHKYLGSKMPCGIVVTRRSLKDRLGGPVELLGTPDTTIGGSRSGHAPLILWYALHRYGLDGLRDRARYARQLAEYTVGQLTGIGWPAWRHPHAMTVVLDPPPAAVTARWPIPTSGGRSHLICLPNITPTQIDALVHDLAELRAVADRPITAATAGSEPPPSEELVEQPDRRER